MIHKQDKDRARLIRDFFSQDIHDASLYSIVWNTDATPIDRIASEMIPLIEQKQEEHKEQTFPSSVSKGTDE